VVARCYETIRIHSRHRREVIHIHLAFNLTTETVAAVRLDNAALTDHHVQIVRELVPVPGLDTMLDPVKSALVSTDGVCFLVEY
jgi:hypothetical protein